MRSSWTLILSLVVSSFLLTLPSWAQSEDENFDSIVQRLSQPETRQITKFHNDPFADLRLHGGVGFSQSVTRFAADGKDSRYFSQKGIQAAIGVDLFSPNWIAEGALVNYGENIIDGSLVSLREFDLRIFYHRTKGYFWTYTMGGGVAARYLTISEDAQIAGTEYATPSTIAFVGLMARLNPHISITTEFAARYALIDDTQDKSAFNMTFRLDTHF